LPVDAGKGFLGLSDAFLTEYFQEKRERFLFKNAIMKNSWSPFSF